MKASPGREGGNCIAIIFAIHLAKKNQPPGAVFLSGDGEFDRALASGSAENGGAGKEPPAQGREFGALRLAEPTLKTDAEIVGADGEVTGGLGGPERTAAQAF